MLKDTINDPACQALGLEKSRAVEMPQTSYYRRQRTQIALDWLGRYESLEL
jgi:hypothetical protein